MPKFNRAAATGYQILNAFQLGRPPSMAINGPTHAKRAEDLLWKAEQEQNPADRANLLANAQVHATLALLAAVVHGGSMPEDKVMWWKQHEVTM